MIPIGVEGAKFYRTPIISIGIAILCLIAFFLTWIVPGDEMRLLEARHENIIQYWMDKPYLELPEKFIYRFFSKEDEKSYNFKRETFLEQNSYAGYLTGEREQEELNVLVYRYFNERDNLSLMGWSMTPSKGYLQPGIISYMFLHAGWEHIIFNMLFFYIVGPLLEDVWGRGPFLLFYVFGGIAAVICQASLNMDSAIPIMGASGSVAACVGAFSFRFYNKKIRFLSWYGMFSVPAWLWACFWFGSEVLNYKMYGAASGVAFMAHIGGFLFGFFAAISLNITGVEEKILAPKVNEGLFWQEHPKIINSAFSGWYDDGVIITTDSKKSFKLPFCRVKSLGFGIVKNHTEKYGSSDNVFLIDIMLENSNDNSLNVFRFPSNKLGLKLLYPDIENSKFALSKLVSELKIKTSASVLPSNVVVKSSLYPKFANDQDFEKACYG